MINFKKGPALSLHQVNYVGKPDLSDNTPSTGIVAGMVVRVNTNGTIGTGSTGTLATDKATLFGFAINNQLSGDVIEAGVIGVYALDGASVIETDQYADDYAEYTIGTPVSTNTAGQIITVAHDYAGKIIGWVEGTRDLPGKASSTVPLTNQVTGSPTGRSFTYQSPAKVVSVKLAV
jgi:hypothetical protein